VQQLSLSVILPISGGADLLAATVAECLALSALQNADVEIIIADASGDSRQAAVADRLAATHNAVAVIRYPQRMGYRQILHDAWGVARGAYVAALYLGGPGTPSDIGRLLPALPGHAAVFGYREPPARRPAEAVFSALIRARLAPGLRDPALGLGIFRADLRDLLSPAGPDSLTHAALYAAARRRGFTVAQVAVAGKPSYNRISLADLSAAITNGDAPATTVAPRGTVVGIGVIFAACGLWILRRLRRLS
jgi:hypothetical protein